MKKIINSDSYEWSEGCNSWIIRDSDELSIKHESMPSGSKEKLHFHNKSTQQFYMLKGEASFYVESVKYLLNKHQSIVIEKGEKHFVANESNETLEFIIVSQPNTKNDRIEL